MARKTSPEDNLTDLMRLSLTWSDPKMSDYEVRSRRNPRAPQDAAFARQMAQYYASPDDSAEDPEEYETESDYDSSDSEDH